MDAGAAVMLKRPHLGNWMMANHPGQAGSRRASIISSAWLCRLRRYAFDWCW
jgi:hypothetical protein